jgi:hypothetical protein
MLDAWLLYLRLGLGHITDLAGYDHILYVTALCATVPWRAWRRIVALVTAFTVGHTVALALATTGAVQVNTALVEFLIPCTIVATCLATAIDAWRGARTTPVVHRRTALAMYGVTVAFGCIHGLGFSSYLRALLGSEESIVQPLVAFNIGLEVGQLAIVAVGLAVGAALTRGLGVLTERGWALLCSAVIGVIAFALAVERSIF